MNGMIRRNDNRVISTTVYKMGLGWAGSKTGTTAQEKGNSAGIREWWQTWGMTVGRQLEAVWMSKQWKDLRMTSDLGVWVDGSAEEGNLEENEVSMGDVVVLCLWDFQGEVPRR